LLGQASAVAGVALTLIGTESVVGVESATLGYILFGVAGLLTVVGAVVFGLGIWSWIRALQKELERLQNAALQTYFDQMYRWIEDKDSPLATTPDRKQMARTQTLAVLETLGPKQKGSVLRFLHEHHLIRQPDCVIRLGGANFSGAILSSGNLIGVRLRGVDLSGANLRYRWFSTLVTDEHGALESPAYVSNLEGADLSNAVLKDTRLVGCSLAGATLTGAKLDRADVRGADLEFARGLTQKQINRAYGDSDTLLPTHLKAPPGWSRPIGEQRRERGDV
jgi:hypothetical protein